MNKRKIGGEKEQAAADFLRAKGYRILQMNYHTRIGEIDIVAADGDMIVFVEVKYRRSSKSGDPSSAVTPRKQYVICRVADCYRLRCGLNDFSPLRFDVIGILGNEIKHIENAFEYIPRN